MTDEQLNEVPNQKSPKPKTAKKRTKAKVKPAAPKQDSVYAGITPADCPVACNTGRCVISGRAICAHPYKGGLQSSIQSPEAIRRVNEAKRVLDKRKLDLMADA